MIQASELIASIAFHSRDHPDWSDLLPLKYVNIRDRPKQEWGIYITNIQKYIKDNISQATKIKPEVWHKPLVRELTAEEVARRRFAKSYPAGRWDYLGPKFGRGVRLYLELLHKKRADEVVLWMKRFGLDTSTTEEQLIKRLSLLSDVAKRLGRRFSYYWKDYVDLATLGGYRDWPAEVLIKDLKSWVLGDGKRHDIPYFYDLFQEGMEDFFSSLPNIGDALEELQSVDDWLKDPNNYGGPGSSQVDSGILGVGGKKPRKSKWTLALGTPIEELRRMVLDTTMSYLKQTNTVFQKRETKKGRLVVNADDRLYLKMAYVSSFLEQALQGSEKSTLFMSGDQLLETWIQLSRDTQKETLKIPIDQSAFDHNVDKVMLEIFCDVVLRLIERYVGVESDYYKVMKNIRSSLVDIVGEVAFTDEKGRRAKLPIQKGVMSGWRWTALIDTAVNWAELYAVKRLTSMFGIPITTTGEIAQGDDDRVETATWAGPPALLRGYEYCRLDVNPTKFFVDRDRDEFLRQVPQPGEVSGYLARAVNSILWRNPATEDPPKGTSRLMEAARQWITVFGRGAERKNAWRLMLRDLAGGSGLSKAVVESILLTPAALGGLGFGETGRTRMVPEVVEQEEVPDVATLKRFGNIPVGVLGDVIRFRGRSRIVREMGVLPTDYFVMPHDTTEYPSKGFPLSPKWRRDVVTFGLRAKIDELVEGKDWGGVRALIDPKAKYVSDIIESRAGRGMWLRWIKGNLPFATPVVLGYSDLQSASVAKSWNRYAWLKFVNRRKGTIQHLRGHALWAEMNTRRTVRDAEVRVGG